MKLNTIYSVVQKTIAILFLLEGGYSLAGIIATLIIKHMLFLDFGCLFLIYWSFYLWTNHRYSLEISLLYYLFAIIFAVFFKAGTGLLIPSTTNILYVLGFITIKRYSEQTLNLIVTVSGLFRVVQFLLVFWLITVRRTIGGQFISFMKLPEISKQETTEAGNKRLTDQ